MDVSFETKIKGNCAKATLWGLRGARAKFPFVYKII